MHCMRCYGNIDLRDPCHSLFRTSAELLIVRTAKVTPQTFWLASFTRFLATITTSGLRACKSPGHVLSRRRHVSVSRMPSSADGEHASTVSVKGRYNIAVAVAAAVSARGKKVSLQKHLNGVRKTDRSSAWLLISLRRTGRMFSAARLVE